MINVKNPEPSVNSVSTKLNPIRYRRNKARSTIAFNGWESGYTFLPESTSAIAHFYNNNLLLSLK